MARIRTIKPEFWTSEQVVNCSPTSRLLFLGTWNFADDYGVVPYQPLTLKMQIFPGDAFTKDDITGWISELIVNELVLEFEHQGRRYLKIRGFTQHQVIKRPNKKHPQPTDEGSVVIEYPTSSPPVPHQCGTDTAPPPPGTGTGTGRELEGKGKGKKSIGAKPPNPDDENFERLWMKRPPRAGSDPKKGAREAFNARRKEGATVEEIERGMERYRRYLEAVGNLNTQFAMRLVTFLGPDRHYLNDWTPPATAQSQRDAAGEVAMENARRMIFGADDNAAPNPFGFGDVIQGELA